MTASLGCYWHPDRETGLRCGSCGRSICVECMRQHPVGIRCKECLTTSRLPTHQASSSYIARGVFAAIGIGLAGNVALAFVTLFIPGAGVFFLPLMFGLGYAMAEGVSAAVNRRRGRPYQYIGLLAVGVATAPVWLYSGISLGIGGLIDLAGIACAAFAAWRRLEA